MAGDSPSDAAPALSQGLVPRQSYQPVINALS